MQYGNEGVTVNEMRMLLTIKVDAAYNQSGCCLQSKSNYCAAQKTSCHGCLWLLRVGAVEAGKNAYISGAGLAIAMRPVQNRVQGFGG